MKTILKVTGMTCGHCVNAVTEELMKISGVSEVDVNLEENQVTVESSSSLSSEALNLAIEEAGYELAAIN